MTMPMDTVSPQIRKQTAARAVVVSEECDYFARLAREAADQAQLIASMKSTLVAVGAAASAAVQAAADAESSNFNATSLFNKLTDRTLGKLDIEKMMQKLERARQDARLAFEEAETHSRKAEWLSGRSSSTSPRNMSQQS